MRACPVPFGPYDPNLGHAIGRAERLPHLPHAYDRLEEGMILGLHVRGREPQSAGCNVGDLQIVAAAGFESLSRRTPLETRRVAM